MLGSCRFASQRVHIASPIRHSRMLSLWATMWTLPRVTCSSSGGRSEIME